MAEYASGLSFGTCCNLDKERIRHALNGELMVGEDENGFIYEKADKADCDDYILHAYDNVVFLCKQAYDSGRALDAIMQAHGVKVDLREYMETVMKENQKFNDYVFERDIQNN